MLVIAIDREHCKAVYVVKEAFTGSRRTEEIVAWCFARRQEFTFCPVTHDLERRFSVHDHCCCQVPVTTWEVRVNKTTHHTHLIEHCDHCWGCQGFLIQIYKGFAVAVRAQDAQSNGFKYGCVLPSLTTVRQRNDTRGLQLFRCCVEFVPAGWHCNAIGFQHVCVCPDPVNTVYVYWRRAPCAFAFHVTSDGCW